MIHLLAVGSPRPPLADAILHYEDRLPHYWKIEVHEVAAGAHGGSSSDADAVMEAEAGRLLGRLPERADLWALTRDGKSLSSSALATELGDRRLHAAPPLVLVIGGAWGLHPSVLRRASRRLSLSSMTLPHELARLLLAEQLYRAGTILRGEPYHKGEDTSRGGRP